MDNSLLHIGELFSLLTAVAWGFAVILFKKSGETVHPVGLNLAKNSLAIILILPTMYLFGETLFRPAPASEYTLLLISGALGIGVADTLFFVSLNLLGAGLIAVVDCFYSPFIIIPSILWLGEKLTIWQAMGVLLVVSAVLTAVSRKGSGKISRHHVWIGLTCGMLGMATQAIGLVMVKPLLERSPLFWVTEIRLIGGLLVLLLALPFYPHRKKIFASLANPTGWKYTLSSAFTGTYVALILWLAGMKYAPASIAAALNQTSNIFIFIFAALFLREPINRARIIGIVLGIAGTLMVTFM